MITRSAMERAAFLAFCTPEGFSFMLASRSIINESTLKVIFPSSRERFAFESAVLAFHAMIVKAGLIGIEFTDEREAEKTWNKIPKIAEEPQVMDHSHVRFAVVVHFLRRITYTQRSDNRHIDTDVTA